MDRCPGLYRDMWREEKYWKRVMRNIDARKGPDRVVQAFDCLATGKHLDEHGQKLDSQAAMFLQAKEALHDGNGSARMAAFARNNPGYFLQRCLYVLSMTPDIENRLFMIIAHDAAQNVGPAAALKAENAVRMRGMAGPRIIRNHNRALVPARVQNAVQLPEEEPGRACWRNPYRSSSQARKRQGNASGIYRSGIRWYSRSAEAGYKSL